jgi:hypothetical protein
MAEGCSSHEGPTRYSDTDKTTNRCVTGRHDDRTSLFVVGCNATGRHGLSSSRQTDAMLGFRARSSSPSSLPRSDAADGVIGAEAVPPPPLLYCASLRYRCCCRCIRYPRRARSMRPLTTNTTRHTASKKRNPRLDSSWRFPPPRGGVGGDTLIGGEADSDTTVGVASMLDG